MLLLIIWILLKLIWKNNINKEMFDELLFNVMLKNRMLCLILSVVLMLIKFRF